MKPEHTPDPFQARRYEADMELKQYKVTWGDLEGIVQAVDEHDAWARFCDGNIECQKHPKAFPRCVEECAPAKGKAAKAKSADDDVELDEDEDSPVDNMNVPEAVESIKRMRSVDKLQHIADNDKRSTVVEAADKRLTELAGS